MPTPLILDVDTGVDDMVALLIAVASPEVELIAATCVTGNVHVDMVTRNTSLVLELAGAGGVEIARGASEPLDGGWQPFPVVHGPEGLGAYVPGHDAKGISARNAATLIAQEAARRPGEVTLIATGPLTNVALALEMEPSLPALLGGFALMGGAYRSGGNVTPRAEANVWMDPEAAARVFDAWSGVAQPPLCVGLDVTERVWLTRDDVVAICAPAPASELATLIGQAVPFYLDFYASRRRSRCRGDGLPDQRRELARGCRGADRDDVVTGEPDAFGHVQPDAERRLRDAGPRVEHRAAASGSIHTFASARGVALPPDR